MKKLLSLIMIASMLSQSAFAAPHHNDLIAKTFNEFRYQMTVLTDPDAPNYKQQAMEDFKFRMQELQKQGVTPAEIMDYMRNTILDQNTRADFDRLLGAMGSEMAPQDAGNIAMKFIAGKYQEGASYSGGQSGSMRVAKIVLGVVIVGVVTYIVYKHYQYYNDNSVLTITKTSTDTKTDDDDGCNNPKGTGEDNGNCNGHDK